MYQVVVARIRNLTPIVGADFIIQGSVLGNTIVVGKDTIEGTLGIFCESDGVLGIEFAQKNNLMKNIDPATGKNTGGMFESNLRVKAQKLRGVKSDGFWCPLDLLAPFGDISVLKEHDKFTEFNGVLIAQKYVVKRANGSKGPNAPKNRLKAPRVELVAMRRHFDTEQFRTDAHKFVVGDLCSISEKCHATSQRFAYVRVEQPIKRYSLDWFKQILRMKVEPKFAYDYMVGTRNVILENNNHQGTYYGNENFRYEATNDFRGKMYKNECLYGEVTYTNADSGLALMHQSTTKLKDKKVTKQYGDTMNYTYGTKPGKAEFWVYRITQTNEDGIAVDLTWQQMKVRCDQLGAKMVPDMVAPFIYDGDQDKLRELVESLTGGVSTIDPSHIREGVCVRAERYPMPLVLKSKDFLFRSLEGMVKDEGIIDVEEAA